LDSLAVAYKQNSSANSQLRESIQVLFQELDNPSAYNAPRFAAQMRRVSAVVSGETRDQKASARP
jgi:hypothetical protein